MIESNEVRGKLLSMFREYDTSTAYRLISSIVPAWGWELANQHSPAHGDFQMQVDRDATARKPGIYLIQYLEQMSFETAQVRTAQSKKQLTSHQVEQEAAQWAAELSQLPFEETIQTFASVVYDWLLTCDLSDYEKYNLTEQGTMKRIVYWLGTYLAVY